MLRKNLSKELKNIFYKFLTDSNVSPKSITECTRTCNPKQYYTASDDLSKRMIEFDGEINFYEWSDPLRKPLKFESITRFIAFLSSSHIALQIFEIEMLLSLPISYVICEKGKHNVIIRGTWSLMRDSLVNINQLPCYPSINAINTFKPKILPTVPSETVKQWFG